MPTQQAHGKEPKGQWNKIHALASEIVPEIMKYQNQENQALAYGIEGLITANTKLLSHTLKTGCIPWNFEEIENEPQSPSSPRSEDKVRNKISSGQQTLDHKKFNQQLFIHPQHDEENRKNGAGKLLKVKPTSHLRTTKNVQAKPPVKHDDQKHGTITQHPDKKPSMAPHHLC